MTSGPAIVTQGTIDRLRRRAQELNIVAAYLREAGQRAAAHEFTLAAIHSGAGCQALEAALKKDNAR
ncbi:hypothetical protein [Ancylobacter sp. G4_0304]|uniref:hypothetical protein n=1 Tax=Ancylobacter sp. G4_0304 TaxID=3114289 RepID=UPI0039C66D41